MAPSTLVLAPDEEILPRGPPTKGTDSGIFADQNDAPEKPIQTIDGLLRQKARTCPDKVIVSYPSKGIHGEPLVVALLGPSNFEYAITMLGLIKLGHTILFLSTRISEEAIESLMKTTEARFLIADPRYLETANNIKVKSAIEALPIASKSVFELPVDAYGDTRLDSALDPSVETTNTIYIIHSSGSTGLPKPIYQRQNAAIANYAINMEMKGFITLPLFHNHGMCNFFRAIYSVKSLHMYNADLPFTYEYLTQIFQEHDFEIFYGVPYALKLLAETNAGIGLLRRLKVVMYGGSACPDELGDLLVSHGVNLISHYGATEVGQLMTSFRRPEDKYWNYVRETEKLAPYLRWIPRGPNLFECAVTEGWRSKVATNQSDGSYNTKDLFEPHPTIKGAWKYIARLDDTLVLVTGEKFNPVQTEGRIRSKPLVTETVVFRAGRPNLGLLIVPSPATQGLTASNVIEKLWPTIDVSNQSVEAYARISKTMITLLPQECQYPRTDKSSIIRQAFYKNFAKEIDATYDQADSSSEDVRAMDLTELKAFLRITLSKVAGKEILADDTADFFSFGVDSLQAIQMRSEILRHVEVGGRKLGQNVVFDHPTIENLATYLISLREGKQGQQISIEEHMQALINKYSQLAVFDASNAAKTSVVVTGATGSLGTHIVAQLAADPTIKRIYCLVRAKDTTAAFSRVQDSLQQRQLYHELPLCQLSKLSALPFTQSDPQLGLDDTTYREIAADLRAVIHCAWAVNFNMTLPSFEQECIPGVLRLMQLCREPRDGAATFAFCSSVSTVALYSPPKADSTAPVPEQLPKLEWAQGMGYAQSKSVTEHVCVRVGEARRVPTRVLRVGQIVGDTRHGVWNATEGIPLIMQTAQTIGALPRLPEEMSWLPVDTVARAVIDITFAEVKSPRALVTNVVNSRTFHWTRDLLPAQRSAGLRFDEVAPKEWIRRLQASDTDPATNPPIQLLEFFTAKYNREEGDFNPVKRYATEISSSLSPALASAPVLDPELVNRFVRYFLETAWSTT